MGKIIKNGNVYAGGVIIDSALDATSENPVQNKVVTGNVKDLKAHTRTNLLNPTAQTQTINGVTFTNNGDGTYTVNGTASAEALILPSNNLDLTSFCNKDIRIVGCPSGGGVNKYQFNINIYNTSGNNLGTVVDFGEGRTHHVPSDAHHCNVVIVVRNGYTANNLLFKPMITTKLDATYDDYIPYSGSGALNENVAEIYKVSDRVSDETYTNLAVIMSDSQTVNGITCTPHADGTLTINGTATAKTFFYVTPNDDSISFENGQQYKLTGCPSDGVADKLALRCRQLNAGSHIRYDDDTGDGKIVTIRPQTTRIRFMILVDKGLTVNNLTFKPMLTTKLDATYDDFIPYSGSGALNENVQKIYDKVEDNADAISQINSDLSAKIEFNNYDQSVVQWNGSDNTFNWLFKFMSTNQWFALKISYSGLEYVVSEDGGQTWRTLWTK